MRPDEFTLNLIRSTITTERVAAVMARIAGERIEVGPLRFGPGGTVAATGVGLIGAIELTSRGPFSFEAHIPGDLTIDITIGSGGTHRYRYQGGVVVPLHITVILEAPTWVVLDVEPLRPADVGVRLQTTGMATFVLQTIGDANREVAAQVAAVVNQRVSAVADLRRIDLAALLDRAWDIELGDLDARLT